MLRKNHRSFANVTDHFANVPIIAKTVLPVKHFSGEKKKAEIHKFLMNFGGFYGILRLT